MQKGSIFQSMTGGFMALPYLFVIPVLFAVFIGLGLTRDDIVEDDVYKIWSSTGSDYYQDRKYARDLGANDRGVSSFLAMATSRDSGNIFTADRLEEIRERMEEVENVTITHNGHEFEWQDICAKNDIGLGTVYKFPCARLTSMDFFQEASWFMTETDKLSWYNMGIQKNLVNPRIPRFGMMQEFCTSDGSQSKGGFCDERISDRTSKGQTLNLFGDLSAMEMNNPCRICIESAFESTMETLTTYIGGLFKFMLHELNRSKSRLEGMTDPNTEKIAKIGGIMVKLQSILGKFNRAAVEEYNTYYTTRGLYSVLGAETYIQFYPNVNMQCNGCLRDMTAANALEIAKEDLAKHADTVFNSINTAGNPYPILKTPIGGSGIDLSGKQLSAMGYFDFATFAVDASNWIPKYGADGTDGKDGFADPDDPYWIQYVESDPVYKWFMAGETAMTAHCGNTIRAPLLTRTWCTDFNPQEDVEKTEQFFAKMWYDLLIDSDAFLGITQGVSNPYTWTTGEGCGYTLKESRGSFTNASEEMILSTISNDLYYLDEGSNIGALNKALLMGGTNPQPQNVSEDNPFKKVTTIQNIYPALNPKDIPDRVTNCNRPRGAVNITVEDAEAILEKFKLAMVDVWSKGWNNNNSTEVQFTGFFDETGSRGTFGILLNEITGDNGTLTAISIIIIAIVSIIFLASSDIVDSMVGITALGIILVVISFFGALGFGVLVGIKINITIAWTLPFIIIGLGVDDMYIVLLALKKQQGNTKNDFVKALKEISIPVTMTSLVNASMFAVMNIVDIGAVYKTAQAALISVIFLYVTILFCFPAYCYLDMRRKESSRLDVLCCFSAEKKTDDKNSNNKHGFFYDSIYKPLLFGNSCLSMVMQFFVIACTVILFCVGIYGISRREIGLGLEDFFPSYHQAGVWANLRTQKLASWPIGISWGALNYTNPQDQLRMIKQYECVVDSPHVSHSDTRWLWMADFNIWTTRHCEANFVREDPNILECGRDQLFIGDEADNNTICSGTWVRNTLGLKNKVFTDLSSDQCTTYEQGICRPKNEMFPQDLAAIGALNDTIDTSYCPVFEGWSESKLKFCVEKWRFHTGGSGGILVKEGTATKYQKLGDECEGEFYNDDEIKSPIPLSSSPTLFSYKLLTHKDTTDLLEETRKICDEDKELHCWMTGIPYDYWEQYLTAEDVLVKLSAAAIAVGFGVSALFLFSQLESSRGTLGASLVGATLIALTTLICLIPVIGISILANVNLTAFSNMAFVLSVGFAVEYSVHVVHRFLSAPVYIRSAASRVEYAMEFLALPLTLSFLSSTAGVACLAFTNFAFNERFFFRPLMIVMISTYFIGTYFLPVFLSKLDMDFLKVGNNDDDGDNGDNEEVKIVEVVEDSEIPKA